LCRKPLTWLFAFLPGCTATVDGKPAKIHRGNVIGRAVYLEAGRHLVTMSCVAPGFAAGALVSSIAWAAWLAGMATVAVVSIRRRRNARVRLRQ
jgi:hypothetical protein